MTVNEDIFCYRSHCAKLVISRTAIKSRFTIEDQIKTTVHVECRKDDNIVDKILKA